MNTKLELDLERLSTKGREELKELLLRQQLFKEAQTVKFYQDKKEKDD